MMIPRGDSEPLVVPIARAPWQSPTVSIGVNTHLWHNGTDLYVVYRVSEPQSNCRYHRDGDPVYRDSCVEFFFRPDGSTDYVNIEANREGWILSERGLGPEGRRPIGTQSISRIRRTPISQKGGWVLELRLPMAAFGLAPGGCLWANFYKCGDETPFPHYLCAFNLPEGASTFHCPESFRPLKIAD